MFSFREREHERFNSQAVELSRASDQDLNQVIRQSNRSSGWAALGFALGEASLLLTAVDTIANGELISRIGVNAFAGTIIEGTASVGIIALSVYKRGLARDRRRAALAVKAWRGQRI